MGAPRGSNGWPGYRPDGSAADGFFTLSNSGGRDPSDATGAMTKSPGEPAMKRWENQRRLERRRALARDDWLPRPIAALPRAGFSSSVSVSKVRDCPCDVARLTGLWRAPGPAFQICRRLDRGAAAEVPTRSSTSGRPNLADPTGCAPAPMAWAPFRDVYFRDGELGGATSRCDRYVPHRRGPDQPRVHPCASPVNMHNVPSSTSCGPPRVGRTSARDPRGRGLPRLRELRHALRRG